MFSRDPLERAAAAAGYPVESYEKARTRLRILDTRRDEWRGPSAEGPGSNPRRRNTLRTRYWLPTLEAAALGFHVRVHDLRHAHASWLLPGGADLKTVMHRLAPSQLQTPQT